MTIGLRLCSLLRAFASSAHPQYQSLSASVRGLVDLSFSTAGWPGYAALGRKTESCLLQALQLVELGQHGGALLGTLRDLHELCMRKVICSLPFLAGPLWPTVVRPELACAPLRHRLLAFLRDPRDRSDPRRSRGSRPWSTRRRRPRRGTRRRWQLPRPVRRSWQAKQRTAQRHP